MSYRFIQECIISLQGESKGQLQLNDRFLGAKNNRCESLICSTISKYMSSCHFGLEVQEHKHFVADFSLVVQN